MITNFEHTDDTDLINKAYWNEKVSKIEGQITYAEKEYIEFKLPASNSLWKRS